MATIHLKFGIKLIQVHIHVYCSNSCLQYSDWSSDYLKQVLNYDKMVTHLNAPEPVHKDYKIGMGFAFVYCVVHSYVFSKP